MRPGAESGARQFGIANALSCVAQLCGRGGCFLLVFYMTGSISCCGVSQIGLCRRKIYLDIMDTEEPNLRIA